MALTGATCQTAWEQSVYCNKHSNNLIKVMSAFMRLQKNEKEEEKDILRIAGG